MPLGHWFQRLEALEQQQTLSVGNSALLGSLLFHFPELLLTGSRPSMASIQSLRSSSDNACMVITPGLKRKERHRRDLSVTPRDSGSILKCLFKNISEIPTYHHERRRSPLSALVSHCPISESKSTSSHPFQYACLSQEAEVKDKTY